MLHPAYLFEPRREADRSKLHEIPFLSYVPIFNPGTRSMKIS